MAKRQRIAKQPFEQGVYPPAAPAERRLPKKRKVAQSTPKRSGNGATRSALGVSLRRQQLLLAVLAVLDIRVRCLSPSRN
jgi:hypothetical protein